MVALTGSIKPVKRQKIMSVDTLNIHKDPHLDEIVTAVIVALFGGAEFPGVRAALERQSFNFDELNLTREEFVARRTLPIGTGFGTWFNEHLKVGERMVGHCAATLATLRFKLDKLPALRRLRDETFKCDTTDECREWMLASLIKCMHRFKPGRNAEVITWAVSAIYAIIAYENLLIRGLGKNRTPTEKSIVNHLNQWFSEKEAGGAAIEDRIKRELLRRAHKSDEYRTTTVTELSFIVQAMARTGVKDQVIHAWTSEVFESQLMDQIDFFTEVDKIAQIDSIEIDALLNGVDRKIWLTVVESDSNNAHRAARYVRNLRQQDVAKEQRIYGMTLVGSSAGNKILFTDRELKDCKVRAGETTFSGIQEVAIRMIRALELTFTVPAGPLFPSIVSLGSYGEGPDSVWYYFKSGEVLMNGSSTHPKAPSRLSLEKLAEELFYAYHPDKFKMWLAAMFPASKYPRI